MIFILTFSDDVLWWYEHDLGGKPRGGLNLGGCTIVEVNKDTFNLTPPNGMIYTLTAPVEEKIQWVQSLQIAIYRANEQLESGLQMKGWLEKKGKRRWFVLKESIL